MKLIFILLALFTPVAATLVLGNPAVAGTNTQSATGSGQFEVTSDSGVTGLRTFSFEATKSSDGTVSGEAQVKNRATGATFHTQIDCLNVIGNVAIASGTVISSSGPGNAVGDAEIFGVQDNGQGVNASPDRITRAFDNIGLVCTDITAQDLPGFTGLFNPIEHGNIEIH